ncbi:MAG: alpha/beta fold hydrolase [Pseudomonadota bacterium]
MSSMSGFNTERVQITQEVSTRVLDTGGDGPPLVLIHGLAASIEIWRHVIDPLSENFRVVAFDLPGFGYSDKPDADYKAVTFFIPILKAFLDAVELPRAHFVGSSMGASLIIRFAARHPQMVDRAVMANPGGFGRYIHPFLRVPTLPLIGGVMSRPQRVLNAFGVRLAVASKEKRTKALIDEADMLSKLPGAHRAFVRTLRGLATPFYLKDLDEFEEEARQFRSPALVVWGKEDRIFPVKQAQKVAKYMPGADAIRMERVGHYPQIDAPEEFVALIESHLMSDAAMASTSGDKVE